MTSPRVARAVWVSALLLLLLLPRAARAQSSTTGSIAGVAKDTTGAVLAGVTVEASSPVLIEKVRTVVTDGQGQYKIVDLRPGTYTVVFTLDGFSLVKREGIELTTGFTASANVELKVGTLAETITVQGASPIVDVQNVRGQTLLTRELLDTLPQGRTIQGYGALTLGTTTSAPHDVGGNKGELPGGGGGLMIHGSRNDDNQLYMDGMRYNASFTTGGGFNRMYFVNQAAAQEVSLGTSGQGAEDEVGGVKVNIVPKDGGNLVKGTFNTSYSNGDLQAANSTDALFARGLTTGTPGLKESYDVGGGLGGPIKKDKLWFYGAVRWWGVHEYQPGAFFNKTQGSLLYTADLSRPGFQSAYNRDTQGRLTWQASQRHKFTISESFQRNCACYRSTTATVAPEATIHLYYYPISLTQGTWSYPATNRLLFQGGATSLHNGLVSERAYDGQSPNVLPILELATGLAYNAGTGYNKVIVANQANARFVVSYVTGSHAFKMGLTLLNANQTGTLLGVANEANGPDGQRLGPVRYTLRNGVPNQITYFASPRGTSSNRAWVAGIYVQDQWTLGNLTLNLGVRFDTLRGWTPEQQRPAGAFASAVTFARVNNIPDWKDVSPRLGGAYNLFGNGKTAVKGSLGRYVVGDMTGMTTSNNPINTIVTAATRNWTDNGDFVPQSSELGPLSNNLFGSPVVNSTFSPDLLKGWGVRQYTWQGSASVQHELRSGMGLTVAYFRTSYGNFTVTDNLSQKPTDFSPYCITAPADARLPGGGGNKLCGLYDISPAAFGQAAAGNLVVPASTFGKRTEVYNGLEVNMNARFGQGGLLIGGVSTGKTVFNNCVLPDSPQNLFCKTTLPFAGQTQIKLSAVYPLPWNTRVSAVFQNLAGIPVLASYVATNVEIQPTLGRNLGSCGAAAVCNGTVIVPNIIEPNTAFEDRLTQLDLRLSKVLRLGRARIEGTFDAYNIFNGSTILAISTRYATTNSWLRPTSIMGGRIFRFGGQLDF